MNNEFKEYEKKSKFKILKVIYIQIHIQPFAIEHYFINKFWRTDLDILNLNIQDNNKGHCEKFRSKQHFGTTFRPLTKKTDFSILEHCFGPLYHACTQKNMRKSLIIHSLRIKVVKQSLWKCFYFYFLFLFQII